MAVLLVIITLGLYFVSEYFVMPYLQYTGALYGSLTWMMASDVLGFDNLAIVSIIFVALLALLVVQLIRRRPVPNDTVYMAGVGAGGENRSYKNSFGKIVETGSRNWYMESNFGEKSLGSQATVIIAVVMTLFLVMGLVMEVVQL
jgi:hypothetical protein